LPGAGLPTGAVNFFSDGVSVGSANLTGAGLAVLTTATLPAGTHLITAQYAGDTNFLASLSPALTQQVNLSPTTTTLVSSPSTTLSGQAVTFTATVPPARPGTGTPPG